MEDAPNIDIKPGRGGRLVYDKERRTIVAAESSADYRQQRGVAWDIIEQAINTYDSWMLDDDYDANRVLKEIITQMRDRRALYMPHERT